LYDFGANWNLLEELGEKKGSLLNKIEAIQVKKSKEGEGTLESKQEKEGRHPLIRGQKGGTSLFN